MALRTDNNLRAGLYARVSTEDRGQDPETQLRPLREYAERRGFAVVGEFVDHASGTTESRPRYQQLLEAARKRELDVVLVWRYDRFARSTRALVNALGEFKARGVAFISYQENVDTTTPQGELVFGMMANLAQFESALIGEREGRDGPGRGAGQAHQPTADPGRHAAQDRRASRAGGVGQADREGAGDRLRHGLELCQGRARFRLAACRRRAYRGLATTPGRENGDGQGPEEDQPRGQEAQGRQEEARPAARHRVERVRQAEGRRTGGGEAEVGAGPQARPTPPRRYWMPSSFSAWARVSSEAWWSPALCSSSPLARSCLTFVRSAWESLGLAARALSIFAISCGQWNAKAGVAARTAAPRTAAASGDRKSRIGSSPVFAPTIAVGAEEAALAPVHGQPRWALSPINPRFRDGSARA